MDGSPRESELTEAKTNEANSQDEDKQDDDGGYQIENTSPTDEQPGPSINRDEEKLSTQVIRKERLQRLRELHLRRVSLACTIDRR